MNLKLLFFCLFLAVLVIPAELRRKKYKYGHHEVSQNVQQGRHEKKRGRFKDIIEDFFFEILDGTDDDDDDDDNNLEWLIDLQEHLGQCVPNPCLNNGVCEPKGKRKFKCDCPRPFKGDRCEKVKKICKRGICGRGECVLTSHPPYYECKCKEPFQPPDCRNFKLCEPNPCRNGGKCIKDGEDFDCQCPPGYRGRFCHVGPNDCYVDDGESYRGHVSETDDGDECLYWNSHFILEKGVDPFNSFEDKDGLGPHNFCRNPDGDTMPWCFFRRGRKLLWDHCDVTECPKPTDVAPTGITPPVPDPSFVKPQPTAYLKPTTAKPPTNQKPSEAPQTSPAPTDGSLIPSTTVPQLFSTCGKPQPKKQITRIFGGLKVAPGALPWQVSLQVRPKNTNRPFTHICGGVLIASCWVLTAGHCIERRKDMQVVMGGLSLDTVQDTEQTINVEAAIVHENYRETPNAVYNDIALLRLNGTDGVCANESQFVKTACLPDAQLPDGMECTISGWGATEESIYGSNHLLEANVLLINQQKCSEPVIYGPVLDNTMFCAGHLQGGVDSCQGDSGGPLTCKENNINVIYGLVSWGDQCGRKNKPGVYTRVTHFLNWIKSKTEAASP
ncbi:hyaluronan-binding protein 2-like isoform X2 [Xiphias gladius]|uniref:hyaluronan-binding protein 2-like isoform X2 n=1 Tax=Xiphias gladius TaxID=8245 RepID=UPI001A99B44D|nr:hyaluronan-binding protein 2-like isoform X2 [Xiphias gladius]